MALSPADDYPVHQLPVPIAETCGERNFYDRYWFNGYSPDGEHFFIATQGVYPQLGVADAAFSVVCGERQYSLSASRYLGGDRTNTKVGPISIEVLKPLQQLRIRVEDTARGFEADLLFDGRFEAVEEPRHQWREGSRIRLDSTRLTQLGNWSGHIRVKDHSWQLEPGQVLGTRDRSWGIRPVGRGDSQPQPSEQVPQFYWLWAPAHLSRQGALFYRNDDSEGLPWQRQGHLQTAEGRIGLTDVHFAPTYHPGTRRVASCTVSSKLADGRLVQMDVQTGRFAYMCGVGYMHPEWGHGVDRGPEAVDEEEYDLTQPDQHLPPWLHVQAISQMHLEVEGQKPDSGHGVLEQLLLGPHAPSGFGGLLDPVL